MVYGREKAPSVDSEGAGEGDLGSLSDYDTSFIGDSV